MVNGTSDPRYLPEPSPDVAACLQEVLVRLDTIVQRYEGPRHSEQQWRMEAFSFAITGAEIAGVVLGQTTNTPGMRNYPLGFKARSLRVTNTSNQEIQINLSQDVIPARCYQHVILLDPARDSLDLRVYRANTGAGDLFVLATEERLEPTALNEAPVGGSGPTANVAITAPLGEQTEANSVSVAQASDEVFAIGSTDGAQATIGTTTDAVQAGAGNGTVIALLKGIISRLTGALSVAFNRTSTGAWHNLWNAAAVGAAGTSALFSVVGAPLVTVHGNASAPTTISLLVSVDATIAHANAIASAVIPGGGGDFGFALQLGGIASIWLQSSAAATITASAGAST